MKGMQRFQADYDVGWIGFTNTGGFVADSIAWGERHEVRPGEPRVTHAFIVTGENAGIEAHIEHGVARFSMLKYFADPACEVYFRRPVGLTDRVANGIVQAAESKLGAKYDTSLIVADALADTFAGELLDRVTGGRFGVGLRRILDDPKEMICSELAALALNEQPIYRGRGCLARPLDTIDPQQLHGDPILWVN